MHIFEYAVKWRTVQRPYAFGDLLALARRSWIAQVRARVADEGFAEYRQTDAVVLRLLTRRPLAIGELGEALGVSRQAARKLADGMLGRRYVAFEQDPTDARRTLVVLTPAGEAYARVVADVQAALNMSMRERVSARDLAAADRVLRTVVTDPGARSRLDLLVPPPTRPGRCASGGPTSN